MSLQLLLLASLCSWAQGRRQDASDLRGERSRPVNHVIIMYFNEFNPIFNEEDGQRER